MGPEARRRIPLGKASGSPFPPVRPRFPEVLCSLTAASPTGDQGSHVCGSERPWLESPQRSLVSRKDGGAAGGAVGTKEAGHSFLAPVPDEKQLGGERVRWFVCFPHNSRSQFIIAGTSRQELEAAGHLPSTVFLGNENVKVAHTLNACACCQLAGGIHPPSPPPPPPPSAPPPPPVSLPGPWRHLSSLPWVSQDGIRVAF